MDSGLMAQDNKGHVVLEKLTIFCQKQGVNHLK